MAGWTVVVAYRPIAGREAELLDLTREHHPILLREGLVTDRKPYIMRSKDGTLVECFEWASLEATEHAHTNPVVLAMWQQYAQCCEYVKLPELLESDMLFAGFESVD